MSAAEFLEAVVHWLSSTYDQVMTHPKSVMATATAAQTAPLAAEAGIMNSIWSWIISALGFILIVGQLYYMRKNGKIAEQEAERKRALDAQVSENREIERRNARLMEQKLQLEIEELRRGRSE